MKTKLRKILTALVAAALARSAGAADMFAGYEKKWALGYEGGPAVRHWLSDRTGLDFIALYSQGGQKSRARGASGQASTTKSGSAEWGATLGGVRSLGGHEVVQFHLLYRAGYAKERFSQNNDSTFFSGYFFDQRGDSYSLSVGPEIEIKVPYLSRLTLSASVLGSWNYRKARSDLGNGARADFRSTGTGFFNDGFSLRALLDVGIRYWF